MGHIEVILSFVIFISFLVFILIFLNPIKKISKDSSSLEFTESKILDYLSANLTSVSLILNSSFSSVQGACLYFNLKLEDNIIVKESDGAEKDGDYVYFNYSGNKFYKIYSSIELVEKNFEISNCRKLNGSEYNLGVINTKKIILDSKLNQLIKDYNNYEILKNSFSINNEFSIIIKRENQYLFKLEKFKPNSVEVIAKEIPIEVLNENAEINTYTMQIITW